MMAEHRVGTLTTMTRLLVAGATFLFVMLAAAATFTNGAGLDIRQSLTDDNSPATLRLAVATEIEQLLGRGGFAGHLMSYASDLDPVTLTAMEELLDLASIRADDFAALGTADTAAQYLQTTRGRIARGRISLASITGGVRAPEVVAIEFSSDLPAFDDAYDQFKAEEQQGQVLSALDVLNQQRWITSFALAAAVLVMGAGAILLHLNVRRPIRRLAENLEELLTDEEGRTLREVDRPDEIGDLARVAEQLRRTQLQAGRLLTFGDDGTLRLRLEGDNGKSVDNALEELTTAAGSARTSALSMSDTAKEISNGGREALQSIESALDKSVNETSTRLNYLTKAGEQVVKFAENLDQTGARMSETEAEWRGEISIMRDDLSGLSGSVRDDISNLSTSMREDLKTLTEATHADMSTLTNAMRDDMTALATTSHGELTNLTGTVRDELDTLHQSTQRLSEISEDVADRVGSTSMIVSHVGERLIDVADDWQKEQAALNEASVSTRENLAARLVTLDVQMGALDDTLFGLDEIATRAAEPIENAAHILGNAVQTIGLAGDSATASVELLSNEIVATREARETLVEEIETDRALWETARMELNNQAGTAIDQMGVAAAEIRNQAGTSIDQIGEAANRMEGLAKELTDSTEDVPGRMDRLAEDMLGLSAQIHVLEQSGGALASQLGGRMASMHDMLDETRVSVDETRATLIEEADTIRGVTTDLKDLHLNFEEESRLVGKNVHSVAGTIESLDQNLKAINERVATPVDLSPILIALKDEVGGAITHLDEAIELQGMKSELSVAAGTETINKALGTALTYGQEEQATELASHFEALSGTLEKMLGTSSTTQREMIAAKLDETSGQQQDMIIEKLNENNIIQRRFIATDLEASAAIQHELIAATLEESRIAERELIANDLEETATRQFELISSDIKETGAAQNKILSTSIAGLTDRFDNSIHENGKVQAQEVQTRLANLTGHLKEMIESMGARQNDALNAGLSGLSTNLTDSLTNNLTSALSDSSEDQLQLVATGLSELSATLNGKIAAQSEAAQELAETLCLLDDRLAEMAQVQDETRGTLRQSASTALSASDVAALIEPRFDDLEAASQQVLQQGASNAIDANDIVALIEPRLEGLNTTAQSLGDELRSLSYEFANRESAISPQVLGQIARVEQLQGGLGEAQQAIALALHDGLQGIARRLKTSDVGAVSAQLGGLTTTLVRQQDRLAELVTDMSSDMGSRIDEMAGEIARGNRAARGPQTSIRGKAINAGKTAAGTRVAATDVPESDLSAIYDALRGLTEELKGISDEDVSPGAEAPTAEVAQASELAPEKDRKVV